MSPQISFCQAKDIDAANVDWKGVNVNSETSGKIENVIFFRLIQTLLVKIDKLNVGMERRDQDQITTLQTMSGAKEK